MHRAPEEDLDSLNRVKNIGNTEQRDCQSCFNRFKLIVDITNDPAIKKSERAIETAPYINHNGRQFQQHSGRIKTMSRFGFIQEKLEKAKIVPVVGLPSASSAVKLADLLVARRLPIIEVTFRTSAAVEGMAAIKKAHPEVLVIAGTVLTSSHVDQAIDAGASAIVSPGFTPALATHCDKKQIPFFPGVSTPSEIQAALEAGLETLKFFPAELAGGVKMLSAFGAVYQNTHFMPTGGITPENLEAYLKLANVVCCGGTWLCPGQLMVEDRWDEIEERILNAQTVIDKYR